MKRSTLLGLAALVAGAAIALLMFARGNAGQPGRDTSGSGTTATSQELQIGSGHRSPAERPSLPANESAENLAGDELAHEANHGEAPGDETNDSETNDETSTSEAGSRPYREYVRSDGTVVRDHRDRQGVVDPDFVPAVTKPSGPRKVKPEVTIAVRNAIRPIVHKCSEQLDPDAMGPNPRMQGQIIISIMDGQLSVDRATFSVSDVAEVAAQAFILCVKEPAVQILLPLEGHEAITDYRLSLPFRLRR